MVEKYYMYLTSGSIPNSSRTIPIGVFFTNVAETLGLGKKTPMGIVLDEFGIEPEVKYM
jgi:hypothetical protein